MNKFSKVGLSALLSLCTLNTVNAMNFQQEADSENTNDSIDDIVFNVQQNEALMQAVKSGSLNAVQRIQPHASEDELYTALELALDIDNDIIFQEILEYMLDNTDFFLCESYQLMEDAAELNKPNVFEYLIRLYDDQYTIGECLYLAALYGHQNIIEIIEANYDLEALENDVDDKEIDFLGNALLAAVDNGHEDIISFLMKNHVEYYKTSDAIGCAISCAFINENNFNKNKLNNIFMRLSEYATLKDIGDALIQDHENEYQFSNRYIKERHNGDWKEIKLSKKFYLLKCVIQENSKLKDKSLKQLFLELYKYYEFLPLAQRILNDLKFGFNRLDPNQIDYFKKHNLNHLNPTADPDVFGRTRDLLTELKTIIDTPYIVRK